MHKLLVWTGKGGTGKTTTVANAGVVLAQLGHDVLLVGFDPQGHLELTFAVSRNDPGIVRVEQLLAGGIDPRTATIEIPVDDAQGRLRLLPCSQDLAGHTAALARRDFQDLDRLLEAFADDVDIVLVDTQGAMSAISHTAARAADSVVFSMEPGFYEYESLNDRLDELEQLSLPITPLGVFFVRCDDRSRHMREYREHFQDAASFGAELYVFSAHTHNQVSVREHPRFGRPTVLAEPASKVAVDYRAFGAELVERILATAEVAA